MALVASRLVAAVAVLVGGSANEPGSSSRVSYGDSKEGRERRVSLFLHAVSWRRSASATKKKIDKTETTTRNFASLPFRSFSAVVMPLALATIARTID